MRLREEQELGHLGLKVDSAPKRTCGRVEVANAQRGAAQREPDVALQAVEGQTPCRQAVQCAGATSRDSRCTVYTGHFPPHCPALGAARRGAEVTTPESALRVQTFFYEFTGAQ